MGHLIIEITQQKAEDIIEFMQFMQVEFMQQKTEYKPS